MLLTRIGTNSRMVITGDLEQSDRIQNNGLKDLMKKYNSFNNLKNIELIQLDVLDVQRSDLVSQVLNMYNFKTPNIQISLNTSVVSTSLNTSVVSTSLNTSVVSTPLNVSETIVKSQATDSYNKYINENGNDDAALIPKKDMMRIISLIPPLKKN